MIGNDIVDLEASCIESNWRRKGWIEKVFAPSEQAIIAGAVAPDTMVWLLWSMKEAAYKLYNRSSGLSFFAPARFECTIGSLADGNAAGRVRLDDFRCDTKSLVTSNFIHTCAASADNKPDRAIIYLSDQDIPRPYPKSYIFFKDKKGIPYLLNSISGEVKTVSYSHHGRLEALAFFE